MSSGGSTLPRLREIALGLDHPIAGSIAHVLIVPPTAMKKKSPVDESTGLANLS